MLTAMNPPRKTAVLVIAFLALWVGQGHIAVAQFADDVCDSRIWESLEARAWLEAEREIAQDQHMVFKPDSVLEYTCFNQLLPLTGAIIGPIFTENQEWGGVLPEDALDNALESLVAAAVSEFLFLNFGHTYLGGRAAEGEGGGSAFCDAMAFIWPTAKCWNVMTDAQDGFYSFEQYEEMDDVRLLPEPCESDGRWGAFIDIAMRDPPWYPPFAETTDEISEIVRERLIPGACDIVIPVEVTVRDQGPLDDYPDGFCPNPGCTYDGTACQ
jgi:hypothetical protein